MKSFRDVRVIPVVLVAIFGLVVLKIAGLVLDGGYVFDYDPQSTSPSWAQETFNFPGSNKARVDRSDFTGSVKEEKNQEPPKQEAAAPPQPGKPFCSSARGPGRTWRRTSDNRRSGNRTAHL